LGYQSHEVAPASEPQASEAETSEAETPEAETPEAEASEPEAAALSESEAPTLTVMWRPAPVKRGKNTRRKAGAKTGRPAKGKNPQAKNGRGKAQDKKPDMNSPFAVLQSLSLDKQPDKKR
jgi:hypothetical protein